MIPWGCRHCGNLQRSGWGHPRLCGFCGLVVDNPLPMVRLDDSDLAVFRLCSDRGNFREHLRARYGHG